MKIRTLLIYGGLLGLALTVLSWADSAAGTGFLKDSYYGGFVGIVFLILGLWLGNWGNKKRAKATDPESMVAASVEMNDDGRLISEAHPMVQLSDREHEVLQCLAEGLTNKEIAGRLFISENTVKTHLQNLYQKLEASRRTQAVARARELGLIAP